MEMELEIEFDFRVEGEELPDAFLDSYELDMMFEQTRRSIRQGLEHKFTSITCGEHGHAPTFKITGIYDNENEQMDIQYHVDTCCKLFMVRVMRILNQQA